MNLKNSILIERSHIKDYISPLAGPFSEQETSLWKKLGLHNKTRVYTIKKKKKKEGYIFYDSTYMKF